MYTPLTYNSYHIIMNKKLTILISSIVLLGLASCGQDTNTTSQVNIDTSSPATAQEVVVDAEPVAAAPSAYDDFSSAPFAYREYNGQDLSNLSWSTVLFFGQASCGTCQKTDADLKAQASLPDDVSILKVDFDTELGLNQQYGVTTKHTFVLIDADGNEIAKEIGLATSQDIVNFVEENNTSEPVAAASSAASTAAKSVGAASIGAIASKAAEVKEVAAKTAEVATEKVAEVAKETVVEKVAEVKEVVVEKVVEKTETAQKAVEQVIKETPVVAASSGTYKAYNGSVPGNSVLFFHAKWCPSCVAADKNFSSEWDLSIKNDIVKVDYDTNSALRTKYGVTSQHTFVLVDGSGNLIKKMVGGSTSSDLQGLFN